MIIAYIYPDAAPHFEKSHKLKSNKQGIVSVIKYKQMTNSLKYEDY